jgi:DNA-binding transcriptional LysR family regulator
LSSSFSASYAGVVAFLTVANEGSFARAADRLGVGRSAVSRAVQKLEGQLGARLFSRTTRSTSLTSEGERFYENCRTGVEHIVYALDDMRDQREGPPRGRLRIGATRCFGRKVLAPVMGEFYKAYPEVELEVLLSDRVPDFVEDRLDIAFRDGQLADSGVIAKRLIPQQIVVCASPDYARRRSLPTTVDGLASHACINRRLPGGRLRSWDFKVNGSDLNLIPEASIVLNDDALMLQTVLSGDGIAQLPECLVRDELNQGALVRCLDEFAVNDRSHYLCYLSRQHQPRRVRTFIDYISARLRTLYPDQPEEAAAADFPGSPE